MTWTCMKSHQNIRHVSLDVTVSLCCGPDGLMVEDSGRGKMECHFPNRTVQDYPLSWSSAPVPQKYEIIRIADLNETRAVTCRSEMRVKWPPLTLIV